MTPTRTRDDYDDDYGDLDIRKKPAKSSATFVVLLVLGVVGIALFTCVASGVVIAIIEENEQQQPVMAPPQQPIMAQPAPPQGPEAAKLIGNWKGRLVLRGMDRNHVYIFRQNGTLREEVFNLQGGFDHASEAVWRFRNGQIEIDWPGGGVEIATARWIDNNTIVYRIIQHTDVAQNGLEMTFRRQ